MSTFHGFEMISITGTQVPFTQFDGQFCVIVNVASA
jgi:glutathione peroxidase-family protein